MRGSARIAGTRTPSAGYIDLGNEPPLSIGEAITGNKGEPIRRAVSLRWLSGTVLTGFMSLGLMGGALVAALNGSNQLAAATPQPATLAVLDTHQEAVGKGDRIRPVEAPASTRQILQVSTVTRQNDQDLIKLRPFVRISAALSSHPSETAGPIPPYDPLAILGDGSGEEAVPAAATDQIYGAEVDGEVAVKTSPFPLDEAIADRSGEFAAAEVEEIVRAAASRVAGGGVQLAALPFVDPSRFSFDDTTDDPFASLGVRIIPENVTFVSKNDSGAAATARDERLIAVGRNESLKDVLERSDVGEGDADDIVAAMGNLIDLTHLSNSEKIRIAYAPTDADGGTPRPLRVSIYDEGVHQATVARTDQNLFVRADEPAALPADFATVEPEESSDKMPKLYEAVYQTALEQGMPDSLITQLLRIFAYDVDFQTQISPGDAMEVFHSMPDSDDEGAEEEGILYASITLGGVTRSFYRYRTSDDGVIDYYDAEGRSAKKFLMRKPMTVGRFSSAFGYRIHPILGYRILHAGVDWAAPRGTPIMASGDGVVERAGWSSGYGRYTRIQHTNGYETAYGHQSAFAAGIVPGARVRQGQVIGYVGSTGRSTGNHLHYEVRINGRLVDPLKVRLPRGRVLEGTMLADFERERARIDALLGRDTNTRVAASR